jgi:hypothetical protein
MNGMLGFNSSARVGVTGPLSDAIRPAIVAFGVSVRDRGSRDATQGVLEIVFGGADIRLDARVCGNS